MECKRNIGQRCGRRGVSGCAPAEWARSGCQSASMMSGCALALGIGGIFVTDAEGASTYVICVVRSFR